MELQVIQDPASHTAIVTGRFDVHAATRFERAVTDRVSAARPHVFVDLGAVDFMDSSALALLVRTLKRAMRVEGTVVLTRLSDAARIVLELARLEQLFDSVDAVESGLRASERVVLAA